MRSLFRLAVCSLVWVLASLGALAASETRIALVIGNGSYAVVPRLPNPPKDARAIAEALRAVGFNSVTVLSELSRDRFLGALRGFAAESEKADWAVIYFAGHGIEFGGTNFLIPIDAQLATDRDVQFEAIPLQQVLAAVEGAKKLRLVILDACRDNPFITQMKRSLGSSRSIGRGLARVEPEGGVLVAYAAKEGQVALDGEGGNSPFVSSLVIHLTTPGLEINRVFRRVRTDVLRATRNRQEPFLYGSLPDEDFYFRPPVEPPSVAPPAPAAAAVEPRTPPKAGRAEPASPALEPAPLAAGPEPTGTATAERQEPQPEPAGSTPVPPPAKVASLEIGEARKLETTPAPAARTDEDKGLVRAVQRELGRLGCDPGSTNGLWHERSKSALRLFNRHASLSFDPEKLDSSVLDALRAKPVRVCPLVCAPGMVARGEICVARACPRGQVRDEDGECVAKAPPKPKRVASRPKPEVRAEPKPASEPRKVARPKKVVQRAEPVEARAPRPVVRTAKPRPAARASASCFTFNGQRMCE